MGREGILRRNYTQEYRGTPYLDNQQTLARCPNFFASKDGVALILAGRLILSFALLLPPNQGLS